MRRPKQTPAQRKHAKQERANLSLRRAAVRYSALSENPEADHTSLALCFADLITACDRYRETLNAREQRRMVK